MFHKRWHILVVVFLLSSVLCRAQKLTPFLPDPSVANGTAVLVLPGGSYHWLDTKMEGRDVARRLQEAGFAAYVLEYRTAGVGYYLFGPLSFRQVHYEKILSDLFRALSAVGAYERVGVMGFSAGGHLALMAGELPTSESLRPDFVAAIYPVVTFVNGPYVHHRSLRGFLGRDKRDSYLRRYYSAELSVPAEMPPVFLVSCTDDPVVDWHNAALADSALTAAGIPHKYIQYQEGGHGFGAGSASADWFPGFLQWYGTL